jgi:hypothetical protein
MNVDTDSYSSRCKEINGFWVSKGTFMTFVGGDSDYYTVFYPKIKELFTILGWRCSKDFQISRGLLWKFRSHAAHTSLWSLVSRLNLFHSTEMEWHLLTNFVCLHLSIPTQEIVAGHKMAYSVYLQM